MNRSTFIALLIPLLMLASAMIFRYTTNDKLSTMPPQTINAANVMTMMYEDIASLKKLGIDATTLEDRLTKRLAEMPGEITASMNQQEIIGMILMEYDRETDNEAKMFFTFDMECMDLDHMYTNFLNSIAEIVGDDLIITNIIEDTSKVDYDSGSGTQTISFHCNGKSYQYAASVYNDWFDVGMLTFMNDVISEQDTGKNLYVTSDGYQECIVFYQTKEWSKSYRSSLDVELRQP